jgi:hypothetical protein
MTGIIREGRGEVEMAAPPPFPPLPLEIPTKPVIPNESRFSGRSEESRPCYRYLKDGVFAFRIPLQREK